MGWISLCLVEATYVQLGLIKEVSQHGLSVATAKCALWLDDESMAQHARNQVFHVIWQNIVAALECGQSL